MVEVTGKIGIIYLFCLLLVLPDVAWSETPIDKGAALPLQLASSVPLPAQPELSRYLVSEKLDGVRGRWTGRALLSRNGNLLMPPDWFVRDFPADLVLDGELWAGRARFEWLSGLVRATDRERDWQQVRFMVFDSPLPQLGFAERVGYLQRRLAQGPGWLQLLPQQRFDTLSALNEQLMRVLQGGGEGLMLHREDARYIDGRNPLLIKLKPLNDAEGEVVGYKPGKGELEGLMGSLKLRLADGREFYLGSGFDMATRRRPPAIGTMVTFQYQGMTEKGIPRGARFLRVRLPE